ncbi:hypothetical protein AB0G04_24495 [Actinoplanes sp. NPDC023801]|uniref:hypothetical protein n=1 Tax=Actinoplanes sp. NPDC023801 TaxID=3154595 RepID=UPI0033D7A478
MTGPESLWSSSGLRPFQEVVCVVVGHRGRFGLEVEITGPVPGMPAFIDFVLLSEDDHLKPADFPPVGSTIEALTLTFSRTGDLRLSPR